jgi:hypothetical protein
MCNSGLSWGLQSRTTHSFVPFVASAQGFRGSAVFACGFCFIESPHKHTPNKTGPCPFLHIPASVRSSAAWLPRELNHELERPAAQSDCAVALLQLFHLRLHGTLRLYDPIRTSEQDTCVVALGSPTPPCAPLRRLLDAYVVLLPPRATSLLQHPPVLLLKFLRRCVVVDSFLFAPSFAIHIPFFFC